MRMNKYVINMAPKYYCLIIFSLYLMLCCDFSLISAHETQNPPSNGQLENIYPLDRDKTDEHYDLVRLKRDMYTTETTPEKTRSTKKPYGLDNKQATILADAANKSSNYNAKEPKTLEEIFNTTTELPSSRPWQKASGPIFLNATIPPETEIQITRFLDDDVISNKTLREHNITSQQEDHHIYYNSSLLPGRGRDYWVDLDKSPNRKVSEILSAAHRRALTVKLSFEFPFYGHMIKNMTIATGGFLYTGEYVHAWLAATQYIAPLMANFDTSLSNQSFVKFADNGTAFTVQWENVVLQESPNEGSFTFQCTLFDTGNIVFVYRNVAHFIDSIEEHQHPVKVGLSDAYIIDRSIFFVRRKTIYEYHRVDFKREDIRNWTAIVLTSLDTCMDMKTCRTCVTELPRFSCNWCAGRCSNGMDRHRQDWLQNGCEAAHPMSFADCPLTPSFQPTSSSVNYHTDDEEDHVGLAGILGILLTLAVFLSIGIWMFYAYRNPHTAVGQFLIRYRPSTWAWRRGEARYTAASIHM